VRSSLRVAFVPIVSVALALLAGVLVLGLLGAPPLVGDAVANAAAADCMQRERNLFADILRDRSALDTLGAEQFLVRDLKHQPLADLRELAYLPAAGEEPLLACGPSRSANHPDALHVLYADGSVRELRLEHLKTTGLVPPDTSALVVGPDSALPELRKLRRD